MLKLVNTTAICSGVALLAAAAVSPAAAVNFNWTGAANDGSYTNDANWQGGSAPNNADFGPQIRFGNTDPTPETITGPTRDVQTIEFFTAGWSLDINFDDFRSITSAGAGTNRIERAAVYPGTRSVSVAAGNTLEFTNELYMRNNNVNLSGGGTLYLSGGKLTGYGSPEMRINDALMRVDASDPMDPAGTVFLNELTSILELETTNVAAVESLFGGEIQNGYGSGDLVATQVGDYVQVAILIPEPASLALVALGGLVMMPRHRKA